MNRRKLIALATTGTLLVGSGAMAQSWRSIDREFREHTSTVNVNGATQVNTALAMCQNWNISQDIGARRFWFATREDLPLAVPHVDSHHDCILVLDRGRTGVPQEILDTVAQFRPIELWFLGGTAAIPEQARQTIEAHLEQVWDG